MEALYPAIILGAVVVFLVILLLRKADRGPSAESLAAMLESLKDISAVQSQVTALTSNQTVVMQHLGNLELSLKGLDLDPNSQRVQKAPIRDKTGFPPLPPEGIMLDAQLQSLEKHYVEEALKAAGGNESKAAKLLNINHHTFRYRKKKLLGE